MIPQYLQFSHFQGRRIHVGLSGSIAAYKTLDLCRAFQKSGLVTSGVLSPAAEQFITRLSLESLGINPVHSEMFPAHSANFDHLEPGQNAALMLIHPLTANSLAKIANGLADTMLTCQALAFPGPLVLVPAMNPNLWNAPATLENADRLQKRENVRLLLPDEGEVACGDQGSGKLPPLTETYFQTLRCCTRQDMSGLKILISLGATREFLDPVRFWSNPSSGRMGAALALAAWLRGAEVTCVCAPCSIWLPREIQRIDVVSAREMLAACCDVWNACDIGCMSAAVCDFRPQHPQEHKLKKNTMQSALTFTCIPNPDILKTLGAKKTNGQRLVGFAAESDPLHLAKAQDKLEAKNLDLIAANLVNQSATGFEHHTNAVLLINAQGKRQQLPVMSKADLAWNIWDWTLQS